ncbi:unnamed protein product, partial [Choristocarpus tenellus]
MKNRRTLDDAETFLAEGIYRSLKGGVRDVVAATDGLVETQEKLLTTMGGLLDDLRQYEIGEKAQDVNHGAEKIGQACLVLPRIRARVAALRERAQNLENDMTAD